MVSVLVGVLLTDLEGFIDVGILFILLSKGELLCDSVFVAVRKVSIEVLLNPALLKNTSI